LTHLKVIELAQGRVTMSDLGLGNCPTFSPSDDRIAFLNNSGVGGAELGVWLMRADGSGRRLLGDYGRPKWSPDSRQFMIVSFTRPRQVTLMDVRPEKSGPLQLPEYSIFWEPSWVVDGTIVAAIGSSAADTIALIDVSDPAQGKVKQVLWRKEKELDVTPYHPLYSASTRRCVFVGAGPKGMALYSFQSGQTEPPKRLEPTGYDNLIQDLAYSPDGRYVLFSSNRPSSRQPLQPAAGGRDSAQRKGQSPGTAASRGRLSKIYFTVGRPGSLTALDPETGEREALFESQSFRERISPDGRTAAYSSNDALWVRALHKDAEPRRILELGGATSGSPAAWSADGKQMIVSLGRTAQEKPGGAWVFSTVRVNVDGSGREELAIPPEDGVQDWSADGRWLLTASSRGAKIGWQLYVMRPDGTEQRRITERGNPFYARFSPDGRRVVYTDGALEDQSGIWIVDADGTKPRRVFPFDPKMNASACWSPDGKRIAVVSGAHPGARDAAGHFRAFRVLVIDLDGTRRAEFLIPNEETPDMPDWR
jgi:Tol biopolymer transport system component